MQPVRAHFGGLAVAYASVCLAISPGIIDFSAKFAYGSFELGMPKKQLDGAALHLPIVLIYSIYSVVD
jgi:hypothetical protein